MDNMVISRGKVGMEGRLLDVRRVSAAGSYNSSPSESAGEWRVGGGAIFLLFFHWCVSHFNLCGVGGWPL